MILAYMNTYGSADSTDLLSWKWWVTIVLVGERLTKLAGLIQFIRGGPNV